MALITATECTVYSNITASAATITASGLIPIIRDRIMMMTNNQFTTDLFLRDVMTFNFTARTVVASTSFVAQNFLADDDCFIYNSYRNDGFRVIASVTTVTLTLATGEIVTDELSGRSIMVSVVKWPAEVKQAAALMIAYDYDVRPKKSGNVKTNV